MIDVQGKPQFQISSLEGLILEPVGVYEEEKISKKTQGKYIQYNILFSILENDTQIVAGCFRKTYERIQIIQILSKTQYIKFQYNEAKKEYQPFPHMLVDGT